MRVIHTKEIYSDNRLFRNLTCWKNQYLTNKPIVSLILLISVTTFQTPFLYLIRLFTLKYSSILVYVTYPVKVMKQPVYKSLMFYNLPTLSQFYISPSHYMFHILNRNCNVYSKCFIDCHVVKTYCVYFFISWNQVWRHV